MVMTVATIRVTKSVTYCNTSQDGSTGPSQRAYPGDIVTFTCKAERWFSYRQLWLGYGEIVKEETDYGGFNYGIDA